MSRQERDDTHWSILLHIDSTHVIRGVLMQVIRIDTKKALLEPIDDLLSEEDDMGLWCSRMVCGEYIELEGRTFQVNTVSVKRMVLEPCEISEETPRWRNQTHIERMFEQQEMKA